jgi:hypothetical protein
LFNRIYPGRSYDTFMKTYFASLYHLRKPVKKTFALKFIGQKNKGRVLSTALD